MLSFNIEFNNTDLFKNLHKDMQNTVSDAGTEILNDMLYITKGTAPFDTGQLENDIMSVSKSSQGTFIGQIGISTFDNGFDYGAYRHDYPFSLGPGSLNKGGTTSPMTGKSFEVGYAFASRPTESNAEGYFDYIAEEVDNLFKNY